MEKNSFSINNRTFFRIFLVIVLFCLAAAIFTFIFISKSKLFLALIVTVIFIISFRRIKLGIYLAVFLIPLIPRLPGEVGTANFSVSELIVLVVVFSWILLILINNKFTFKRTKLDLPILMFLMLTFVSFLISLQYIKLPLQFASSANNLYPLKVLLNIFEYILFFYLIVNVLEKKDIKKVINICLASLLIVSLVSTFELIYPDLNLFSQASFRRVAIEDGALKLNVYPIRTLPWGYSFVMEKNFTVNSSKTYSIEGLIKVDKLFEDSFARVRVSGYNITGHYVEGRPTPRINVIGNWTKVNRKFKPKNNTHYLLISANILTINNTLERTVYFDNITLKEDNITIFFEGFDNLDNWVNSFRSQRQASTLNNPNLLGAYLILFLPLAFLLCFAKKNIFFLLASLFSSIILVLTYSKGAVAGFILATVLFMKKNKRMFLVLCSFVFILLIIIVLRVSVIQSVIDDGLSADYRIEIFKDSLKLSKENLLFGAGLGTFRMINNLEMDIHHAHNIYLQIMVERGLLSLLSFLALLFVFYKESLKNRAEGDYFNKVKVAFLIGITAVLIHGLIDYPFYSQRISLLFWMVIGIVSVINMGDG